MNKPLLIDDALILLKAIEQEKKDLLDALQYAVDVSTEGLALGDAWQSRARFLIARENTI